MRFMNQNTTTGKHILGYMKGSIIHGFIIHKGPLTHLSLFFFMFIGLVTRMIDSLLRIILYFLALIPYMEFQEATKSGMFEH